ncbi:hypothetical protein [Lysinibacillus sp. NPDC047702]|uniref:hypothetical protein n=1 Tax=unclassified Lysinibacillus TaxID=2636778 RepID=UPI003D085B97
MPKDAAVFLSYNLDPVYTERQRLATIKENLTKAQQLKGEGQSFNTPTHRYSLYQDGNLMETKL